MRCHLSLSRFCSDAIVALLATLSLCGMPANAQQTRSLDGWMQLGAELEAKGQSLGALKVYGAVAAQRPEFEPAEQALGRMVADMGSPRRGETVLRYLLQQDDPSRASYLAALRQLDREHPLRFDVSAGVLPSTNIGQTSSQTYLVTDFGTFLIENGGKEESGVGAEFAFEADWVTQFALGHRLHLRPSLSGEWFARRQLRFLQPAMTVAYENLTSRDEWGLSGYLRYRGYDGLEDQPTADHRAFGLAASKRWRLDDLPLSQASVLGALSAEYRDYLSRQGYDGRFYQASGTFSHQMDRTSLSYGLRLSRSDVRLDYHRYDGIGLSTGLTHPLGTKIIAGANLRYDWRFYDADFPFMAEPRKDEMAALTLSATARTIRIGNGAPKIRCTYTRNASNVALYRYNSFDCGLALDLTF